MKPGAFWLRGTPPTKCRKTWISAGVAGVAAAAVTAAVDVVVDTVAVENGQRRPLLNLAGDDRCPVGDEEEEVERKGVWVEADEGAVADDAAVAKWRLCHDSGC